VTRATLNPTRDTIRTALRQGGEDWVDSLPALDRWFKGGLSDRGWAFVREIAGDVDFRPSPTLLAVTRQALEAVEDPHEALRRVRHLVDSREHPTLTAKVWLETRLHLKMAMLRAIWAEDRARRRRRTDPRQLTFDFVRK